MEQPQNKTHQVIPIINKKELLKYTKAVISLANKEK